MAAKIPESLAHVRIEELDLSVRSYNALRAQAVKTLGQLANLSDKQLLQFTNLGRKSLREIRGVMHKTLSEHGIILQAEDQRDGKATRSENGWLTTLDGNVISPGGWKVPFHQDEALNTSLDLLDLSARSRNVLAKLDLRTLRELLGFPRIKLLRAENMGRKSLSEIEAKIRVRLTGGNGGSLPQSDVPPLSGGVKAFVSQMLSVLPERERNILADRYGLWDGIAETLQDIGDKLALTRERIRQIEEKGLKRIRRLHNDGTIRSFIADRIRTQLESDPQGTCGIVSEEEALGALAAEDTIEEAGLAIEFFNDVDGAGENLLEQSLVPVESGVYAATKRAANDYREVLRLVELSLQHQEKPLSETSLFDEVRIRAGRDLTSGEVRIASRILSISPKVTYLPKGTLALSEWKEFQKRDAPSVAEATLRLLGRPAHFREIAEKAGAIFGRTGLAGAATIHNALVTKRKSFVWVKPGTYGLVAWGLKRAPFIKDRLIEVLSETRYPLAYWHLKEKVLEVCNCKEDSVRMTLDLNPALFRKFVGDQYGLQSHYSE